MRARHSSSHQKLPIIIIAVLFSTVVFAKKKIEVTNIVCFAAQNKWICAPEDKQEIASKKAQKLLDQRKPESTPSNIVIKSINIPKFETSVNPFATTQAPISKFKKKEKKISNPIVIKKPPSQNNDNPYSKLWAHQLIGVSTPNSAINFVKSKHLNKDDVLIIKSVRKNMDWWIILYGLYKDKKTGLENANNLPKSIKNPWLRPLKNLKVNGFIEDF